MGLYINHKWGDLVAKITGKGPKLYLIILRPEPACANE